MQWRRYGGTGASFLRGVMRDHRSVIRRGKNRVNVWEAEVGETPRMCATFNVMCGGMLGLLHPELHRVSTAVGIQQQRGIYKDRVLRAQQEKNGTQPEGCKGQGVGVL